ncbi:MAG: aldo/keto reductase [Anaerolineaceae bacterium]|nr:aldo/keto reductase [Anaerolineaceae bacterium]
MKRKLGHSNIEMSAMGMGCWAIGGPFWADETPLGWGKVDDDESIRAIHTCLDLGVNLFDTASVYGAGHSERVLGKALKGRRDQAIIVTKFGPVFDEESRQVTGGDVSPKGIRQSCADSLRRLDTDYIDLFLFHFNDHPVEEAAEVRDTLEALVTEGKIRTYGWSTDFADRAEFFAQGPHCSAIEVELNVIDRNPEVTAVCEQYNLAAINRGPLAMGLLTGKYAPGKKVASDDVRGKNSPDWMKYFQNGEPAPAWSQKVNAVRDILTSNGRTLAQGALAWLWAHSDKMVPIPGIRTVAQAEENCKVMDFGPLKPEQMAEIDQILERPLAI